MNPSIPPHNTVSQPLGRSEPSQDRWQDKARGWRRSEVGHRRHLAQRNKGGKQRKSFLQSGQDSRRAEVHKGPTYPTAYNFIAMSSLATTTTGKRHDHKGNPSGSVGWTWERPPCPVDPKPSQTTKGKVCEKVFLKLKERGHLHMICK